MVSNANRVFTFSFQLNFGILYKRKEKHARIHIKIIKYRLGKCNETKDTQKKRAIPHNLRNVLMRMACTQGQTSGTVAAITIPWLKNRSNVWRIEASAKEMQRNRLQQKCCQHLVDEHFDGAMHSPSDSCNLNAILSITNLTHSNRNGQTFLSTLFFPLALFNLAMKQWRKIANQNRFILCIVYDEESFTSDKISERASDFNASENWVKFSII